MDRVEQWQSASGSLPGQRNQSVDGDTGTPVATTPATATSTSGSLSRHLAQLSMGEGESEGLGVPPGMRPLTSTARILEGTFSSDSSTTAMRRAEETRRGVPGALMGPLALASQPFSLTSEAMEVDSGVASASQEVAQTVEAVMRSQMQPAVEGPPAGLLRETEVPAVSSPPGMSGPLSTSSPQGMSGPLSTSSPQGMSGPLNTSSPQGMSRSLSNPFPLILKAPTPP